MKLKEAIERLGISRSSVDRYRKKLGIFHETKKEVTLEQFEELRKLRDYREKYTYKKPVEKLAKSQNDEMEKSGVFLEINARDGTEIKNLKKQYNDNLGIIQYMQNLAFSDIKGGGIPEKYFIDSIEKYQKLNILILNTLKKINPETNDLQKLIEDKLGNYT